MTPISEEQAKQKWCPLSFGIKELRGPDGAGIREGGPWACCTTNCLAWQFVDKTYVRKTELWSKSRNERVNAAYGDDAEWRPIDGDKTDLPTPVGVCRAMRAND